ncbi:MAG: MFS transporter [Deltaproteobacteria bacterium]|nr:MFS transporter [Deltaproteobacteria bacterium]
MEKRLSGLVINSYGYANFSLSLMMSMGMMYYSIFMTDVAGISPIDLGIVMLIGGTLDTISIFVSGSMIQKVRMRWGQFRSWFLFIPVTTFIFFTLSFTNLPLSYITKMVYLTAAYVIGHVSLNFAFNSHLGFISVLTTNVNERMRISVRNIQFGMASQIVFSLVIIPLLTFLKGNSPTMGYFYVVALLGFFQMFGYWNLFCQTKGFETQSTDKNQGQENKITLWEIVIQLVTNRQLLLLMAADCMSQLGLFSMLNMAVYYLKYIANNELWMSTHTLCTSILSFVTALYAPFVINLLGKKRTYLTAMAWGAVAYFLLRAFGMLSVYHFTIIICSGSLLMGVAGPMRQAMYMDAAEYGYYKTGKDASAFIMSMFTIPIKIASSLAVAVGGLGLDFIGYVANTEMTAEMSGKLMDIICYIPAGCGLVCVILMSFYKLNDKNVAKIMEANNLKRAEANA